MNPPKEGQKIAYRGPAPEVPEIRRECRAGAQGIRLILNYELPLL
jgi:hypothetical protein